MLTCLVQASILCVRLFFSGAAHKQMEMTDSMDCMPLSSGTDSQSEPCIEPSEADVSLHAGFWSPQHIHDHRKPGQWNQQLYASRQSDRANCWGQHTISSASCHISTPHFSSRLHDSPICLWNSRLPGGMALNIAIHSTLPVEINAKPAPTCTCSFICAVTSHAICMPRDSCASNAVELSQSVSFENIGTLSCNAHLG